MLLTTNELKNKRDWSSWITSAIFHVVAFAILLSIHSAVTAQPERRQILTTLVYRPPVLHAPPVKLNYAPVLTPKPPVIPLYTPPVVVKQMPAPVPAPQPKPVTLSAPEPVLMAALPDIPRQQIKTELPGRPAPPPAPVKVGAFGGPGESADAKTPTPRLEVQTGGFGGVDGNHGQAQSGSANASARGVQVGGFGTATGNGNGSHNGNGRATVASAGFGDGTAQAATIRRVSTPITPSDTPVEVIWKPKPQYTEEARARKLEGNVTLEVVFHAGGSIEVVRVVRGLGSGLDESARTAAQQIRFRPGKKDGLAIDKTGLVQITFELT